MTTQTQAELLRKLAELKNAHALGCLVEKEIRKSPANNSALPGELKRFAKEFAKSVEMVRRHWKFAQGFTEKQLKRLLNQCEKEGFAISFSIVNLLNRVRPLSDRNKLQKRVIREQWSSQQLENYLRARKADRQPVDSSAQRKRRGKLPRILNRNLLCGEVEAMLSRWRRFIEEVPENGSGDRVGKDDLGKNGIKKIEELTRILEEVSKMVSKRIQ